MRILLSNDDGVHAEGLAAMHQALKRIGDVWVVAPLQEKSTTGHSLTIHKPLRLIPIADRVFGVSGSPADCVYVGIREVLKKMPDLVVSGINRGANMGQDIYYSGTVSAAREACILGLPSVAVSLDVDFKKAHARRKPLGPEDLHYATAGSVALDLIRGLLGPKGMKIPKHTLLNLNVPDRPLAKVKGIRLARQGFRFYSGKVLKRVDHRGKDYFWVGGQYEGFEPDAGTDCETVAKGYAALTPLKLDCTDSQLIASWRRHDVFQSKG